MKGVPALLKTKRIYVQVDEAREISNKTARRRLDVHGIPLVGRVVSPSAPRPAVAVRFLASS